MRILLISWNYPPKLGGMEIMISHLVDSLRTQCEIDVIGPYAEPSSIAKEDLAIRPQRDGLLWFFLSAFMIGWRLSRKHHYDFIMTGSALLLPIAFLLSRLFKYRVAIQVHGLDIIYNQFWYQQMLRVLLPKCDLLFANSQKSKKYAIARGVSASRIKVINPGIHFVEFAEISKPVELFQQYKIKDRRIILSAGRLAPRKGIAEFVRYVLPKVIQADPTTLFIVVGDNPTDSLAHRENVRAQIETAVTELRLSENVMLLGRVERNILIQLYHACHLFVLPAIDIPGDMEGFGIVLLEASAAGKPVVSTHIGGIPDAVVDGQSGILIKPGDWSGMAEVVIGLLKDDGRREMLGQFGRARIRTELDWPIVGKRYLQELQNEFQR